ncbi:hypothetical protein [Microbacterium sp.]|uniref:hypothetical protein n=1 Tax=Microbacterium sp. TaxID=51671 RepID=UPI003C753CC4
MLSTSTLPGIAATTELLGRSRSARLWTVTIIALLVCAVVLMFARIDPFAAAWVPVSR